MTIDVEKLPVVACFLRSAHLAEKLSKPLMLLLQLEDRQNVALVGDALISAGIKRQHC